ncbi:TPA: hypothetical protein P9G65_004909 [Pseudomonas aeruginosa]|nr:hypothetical protein [Pseudomonas aeruginosa]HDQ4722642.1 hypothetical protein [Pseudomonas aeruginosa]
MNAEQAFENAFQRLKDNCPQILQKGSQISQNNVAREAGCDPSALRKSRYPKLIAEIKLWIENHADKNVGPSPRQKLLKQRARNRTLADRFSDAKVATDKALSMLVDADAKILELSMEIERLRSFLPKENITPFRQNS